MTLNDFHSRPGGLWGGGDWESVPQISLGVCIKSRLTSAGGFTWRFPPWRGTMDGWTTATGAPRTNPECLLDLAGSICQWSCHVEQKDSWCPTLLVQQVGPNLISNVPTWRGVTGGTHIY